MIHYHICRIVPKDQISTSEKHFHLSFTLIIDIEIGSLKLGIGNVKYLRQNIYDGKANFVFSISQMDKPRLKHFDTYTDQL